MVATVEKGDLRDCHPPVIDKSELAVSIELCTAKPELHCGRTRKGLPFVGVLLSRRGDALLNCTIPVIDRLPAVDSVLPEPDLEIKD